MKDEFIFKVGTQGDVNPDDIWLPPTKQSAADSGTREVGIKDPADWWDFDSIIWAEHEQI